VLLSMGRHGVRVFALWLALRSGDSYELEPLVRIGRRVPVIKPSRPVSFAMNAAGDNDPGAKAAWLARLNAPSGVEGTEVTVTAGAEALEASEAAEAPADAMADETEEPSPSSPPKVMAAVRRTGNVAGAAASWTVAAVLAPFALGVDAVQNITKKREVAPESPMRPAVAFMKERLALLNTRLRPAMAFTKERLAMWLALLDARWPKAERLAAAALVTGKCCALLPSDRPTTYAEGLTYVSEKPRLVIAATLIGTVLGVVLPFGAAITMASAVIAGVVASQATRSIDRYVQSELADPRIIA